MIWELRHEFKVSLLLDVAKLARSTYYYYTKRRQEPDKYSEIKEQITNIFHENRGRYGYRRITMEMKNRGYRINHKTVQRLMKELKAGDDCAESVSEEEAMRILEVEP